jgi:predicted nucleotide-binding protein (sugar kinase/HSP70/actin superfamily)
VTIGIPRALFHFCYPDLWETFFRALGLPVILSPPTSSRTLERAGLISESEHCLPMKLLDAHIDALLGQADAVLVPRFFSMLPGHVSCTKLRFLPDTARARVGQKARVISLDVNEDREPLDRSLCRLARELGASRAAAQSASRHALAQCQACRSRPPQTPDALPDNRPPILLVSHPYVLHDDYFSGPLVRKLHDLAIPTRLLDRAAPRLSRDFIGWDTCRHIHHALESLRPGDVSGVIQLSSFNCGCDSMTIEFFRTLLREKNVPYMVLMLDEHSAPAGIETRLEAFVDSMRW